jgi:hypothetical protein
MTFLVTRRRKVTLVKDQQRSDVLPIVLVGERGFGWCFLHDLLWPGLASLGFLDSLALGLLRDLLQGPELRRAPTALALPDAQLRVVLHHVGPLRPLHLAQLRRHGLELLRLLVAQLPQFVGPFHLLVEEPLADGQGQRARQLGADREAVEALE